MTTGSSHSLPNLRDIIPHSHFVDLNNYPDLPPISSVPIDPYQPIDHIFDSTPNGKPAPPTAAYRPRPFIMSIKPAVAEAKHNRPLRTYENRKDTKVFATGDSNSTLSSSLSSKTLVASGTKQPSIYKISVDEATGEIQARRGWFPSPDQSVDGIDVTDAQRRRKKKKGGKKKNAKAKAKAKRAKTRKETAPFGGNVVAATDRNDEDADDEEDAESTASGGSATPVESAASSVVSSAVNNAVSSRPDVEDDVEGETETETDDQSTQSPTSIHSSSASASLTSDNDDEEDDQDETSDSDTNGHPLVAFATANLFAKLKAVDKARNKTNGSSLSTKSTKASFVDSPSESMSGKKNKGSEDGSRNVSSAAASVGTTDSYINAWDEQDDTLTVDLGKSGWSSPVRNRSESTSAPNQSTSRQDVITATSHQDTPNPNSAPSDDWSRGPVTDDWSGGPNGDATADVPSRWQGQGDWQQRPYRTNFARGHSHFDRGASTDVNNFNRPTNLGQRPPLTGTYPRADGVRAPFKDGENNRNFSGGSIYGHQGGNERETPGGRRDFGPSNVGPAAMRRRQELADADLVTNKDGTQMYVLKEYRERPNYDACVFVAGIPSHPSLTETEVRFQLLHHFQSFVGGRIEKIRITPVPGGREYQGFVTFATIDEADVVLQAVGASDFRLIPRTPHNESDKSIEPHHLRLEKALGIRTLWIHVVGKRSSAINFCATDTEYLPHSQNHVPKEAVFERFLDRAGMQDGILKARIRPQLSLEESGVPWHRILVERTRRAQHFLGSPVWEPAGKTVVSLEGDSEEEIIKQCCEVFGGLDHVEKWPNESQGGYEVKFWDRESAIRACNQLRLLDGVAVWWAHEKANPTPGLLNFNLTVGRRSSQPPTSSWGHTAPAEPPSQGQSKPISQSVSVLPKEDFPALPGQKSKMPLPSFATEIPKVDHDADWASSAPEMPTREDTTSAEVHPLTQDTRESNSPTPSQGLPSSSPKGGTASFPEIAPESTAELEDAGPATLPDEKSSMPLLIFGNPNSSFEDEEPPLPVAPRRSSKRNKHKNKLGVVTGEQVNNSPEKRILSVHIPPSSAKRRFRAHQVEDDPRAMSPVEAQRAAEQRRAEDRMTVVLTNVDAGESTASVRERCRAYGRLVSIDLDEDEDSASKTCIVTFTSYHAAKQAILGENGRKANNLIQNARFWMDGSETCLSPPHEQSIVVSTPQIQEAKLSFGSVETADVSPAAPAPRRVQSATVQPHSSLASGDASPRPRAGTLTEQDPQLKAEDHQLPTPARKLQKKVSFARQPVSGRRRASSDPGDASSKASTPTEAFLPQATSFQDRLKDGQLQIVEGPVEDGSTEVQQPTSEAAQPQPEFVQPSSPTVAAGDPLLPGLLAAQQHLYPTIMQTGGMSIPMTYYWSMPMPYPVATYPNGAQFPATPQLPMPFYGMIPPSVPTAPPISPAPVPMAATPIQGPSDSVSPTLSKPPRIPGNRPSLSNLQAPQEKSIVTTSSKEVKKKGSLQPLSYLQGPQGLVAVYDSEELLRYRREHHITDVKEPVLEDKSLHKMTLLPLSSGGHSPPRQQQAQLPPEQRLAEMATSQPQHPPPPSGFHPVSSSPSDMQETPVYASVAQNVDLEGNDTNPFPTPVLGHAYLADDGMHGSVHPPYFYGYEGGHDPSPTDSSSPYHGHDHQQVPVNPPNASSSSPFGNPALLSMMRPGSHAAMFGMGTYGSPPAVSAEEYALLLQQQQPPGWKPHQIKVNPISAGRGRPRGISVSHQPRKPSTSGYRTPSYADYPTSPVEYQPHSFPPEAAMQGIPPYKPGPTHAFRPPQMPPVLGRPQPSQRGPSLAGGYPGHQHTRD